MSISPKPLQGLFVVLEGADGSGKSAAVDRVLDKLALNGFRTSRVMRSDPVGVPEYRELVGAVGRVFGSAADLETSFHLLSLAAAAQYAALLESQVLPVLAEGTVVIAESWWAKTRVRLTVEAARRGAVADEEALRDFESWTQGLLPGGLLPPSNQLTILLEASDEDRTQWYEAAGRKEPVYDEFGRTSYEPEAFGRFTSLIRAGLSKAGREEAWPVVTNSRTRSVDDVAEEIVALIHAGLAGH